MRRTPRSTASAAEAFGGFKAELTHIEAVNDDLEETADPDSSEEWVRRAFALEILDLIKEVN